MAAYSQLTVPVVESKPSIFTRVQRFLAKSRQSRLYIDYTRIQPIVTSASQCALRISYFLNHTIPVFDQSNQSFAPDGFKETFKRLSQYYRLTVVGLVPVAIGNIVSNAIELRNEIKKGRRFEQTNAVLEIVNQLAYLGDSIASFASGLATAGIVNGSAVLWATPLSIVSAALSGVTIAIQLRELKKTHEVLQGLLASTPDMSLKWLKRQLLDTKKGDGDNFLSRHFSILHREKYAAQVLHIINSKSDDPLEKAIPAKERKTAKLQLVEALRNRIKDKITSHKVTIVANIIGLIGVTLLLIPVPGLAIVGIGLVAISALLSFGKYLQEGLSVRRLEATIDRLCKYNLIPPKS